MEPIIAILLLLQVEIHIFLGLGAKSAFSSVTTTAKQHFRYFSEVHKTMYSHALKVNL